ncbi:MAG: tetratricopeptide repeat protein [Rhodospirillaceae bacterium]|nr:tetratricopeptide repeat protein [Rhodospirillaceae bacterium]
MSDEAPPNDPADSAATLRQAAQLRDAGDFSGAAVLYRALSEKHPNEAGLWAMLGDTLRVAGDPASGADALEKAAALAPEDTDIAVEWALALRESGDSTAALAALAGLGLDDSPRGLAVQADSLRDTGRFDKAIASYRRLLTVTPDNHGARIGLGTCLQETGALDDAIACYEAVVAEEPDSAAALTNLGLAWSARGDLDRAEDFLQRAAALDPNDPDTLCAWGALLQKRGRADDAANAFGRATSAAPGDARAWSNLGNAYQDLLRLDDALAAHDRAVSLAPNDGNLHWNRAMTLLLSGDLEAGFAAYEWRAETRDHAPPAHDSPRWDGSDPAGKRLLLLAEQGFGDAIQFARYAPLLQARGATVFLQCHPKLTALFEALAGTPTVLSAGDTPPQVDAHAPLMSVPHLLGTTIDTIPGEPPYLRPPDGARRPPAVEGRRRIGLCWTGNPDHPDNAHRSLPFAAFAPLLRRTDIDWRSLQFGPGAADAAGHLPDDPAWTPCLEGFGITAAALESCDLVITIDTSTAHLAGALGRPVWLLLKYAPDWRWMVGRDDSPWYPTARLFRQAAPGDWAGVVNCLDAALTAWMEPGC